MKTYRNLALAFLLSILLIYSGSLLAAEPVRTFELTILHANDFHGANPSSLARQATLIRQIRARERNVLFIHTGDVYARGRYHYRFYGELEFAALNAMGVDALTLGNNEFKATAEPNTAQAYLVTRIKQAGFPILSANVHQAKRESYLPGVKPYIIKEMDGIKLAVFGLTADRTRDYPQIQGLIVDGALATAKELLPKLNAEADIIIAATHIGVGEDTKLAKAVPGIAAIVGGDSHTFLWEPKVVRNVPIVQAGANGKYLGKLDLHFENTGSGWVLKEFSGELIRIGKSLPEDPEVKAIIEGYLGKQGKAA